MPCASVLNANSLYFCFGLFCFEKYLLIDPCNNNCLLVYAYGLLQNHSGGLVAKTVKFL